MEGKLNKKYMQFCDRKSNSLELIGLPAPPPPRLVRSCSDLASLEYSEKTFEELPPINYLRTSPQPKSRRSSLSSVHDVSVSSSPAPPRPGRQVSFGMSYSWSCTDIPALPAAAETEVNVDDMVDVRTAMMTDMESADDYALMAGRENSKLELMDMGNGNPLFYEDL